MDVCVVVVVVVKILANRRTRGECVCGVFWDGWELDGSTAVWGGIQVRGWGGRHLFHIECRSWRLKGSLICAGYKLGGLGR
jgi:hypothetical protein